MNVKCLQDVYEECDGVALEVFSAGKEYRAKEIFDAQGLCVLAAIDNYKEYRPICDTPTDQNPELRKFFEDCFDIISY